jgi:hypothetical protein
MMIKSELLEALSVVRSCVQLHTLVPVMSHFCFKDGKIFTYNGTEGMSIDFDTELNCCVQADLFMKILNNATKEEVAFEQEEEVLLVDDGRIELSILPTSDFVFEFPVETEKLLTLNEEVIKGISKCVHFSNKNSIMESQYGITFQTDADLNSLNLFATDNIRIASFWTDGNFDNEINIIIPLPFCKQLPRLFKMFGEGELSIGVDDTVVAKFGNVSYFTSVPTDIKLLDYNAVISSVVGSNDREIDVIPEMKEAINTTLIVLGSYKDKLVNIYSEGDDALIFEAEGALAACTEVVKLGYSVPIFKCNMDALMVKDFFTNVDCFCVSINENNKTIFYGTQGNFIAIMESI